MFYENFLSREKKIQIRSVRLMNKFNSQSYTLFLRLDYNFSNSFLFHLIKIFRLIFKNGARESFLLANQTALNWVSSYRMFFRWWYDEIWIRSFIWIGLQIFTLDIRHIVTLKKRNQENFLEFRNINYLYLSLNIDSNRYF